MFCTYFKPLTFQSLVPFMSMPRHEFPHSFFFLPDAGAFMSVLRHDFPSSRVFFSGHLAFNKIHGAISGRAMNI